MQDKISERHAMARLYAEANIPVFPCKVNGKEPITPNGFYDATTDLAIIDRWWGEDDYNLAISPGQNNLFVVDIDPGADLSLLSRLPGTYTIRTPRDGYHLYYEGTGKSTASKLAQHVDTRSIGGYVLVPPSIVGGIGYRVETEAEYAPLPSWILPCLATADAPVKAATDVEDLPANIERARKRLSYLVKTEDVATEGCGGDERTYKLCCEMLDLGLSATAAQDLIEELWNPYCSPPWMPEELALKLENAGKFRQNEVGAYGVGNPQEIFSEAVSKLTGPDTPEKLSRFHFKDEGELDDEPDPQWIVKELISERSTVMLYGQSGSYKSFLVLDICLSVAMGLPAFGSDTKPGLVFYAALEGKAHLKKARRAWRVLKGVQGKIENFFVGRAPMVAIDAEVQEFGDEIVRRCAGRKPAIIVIDTLSKSMAGLNENDAADANRYITFCDSLVETFGCTVISVHHSSDKTEGRGARGSSAFKAGFDTVLEVKAHKATKAVSVYVEKHKDAEEREKPWTFEGRITGASLTFEATTADAHKLLTGDSKEVTPKTVGAALKGLGAFGEPAGVTTAVLATQITPARENESVEERAAAIARTGRLLTAEAKGALEGYVTKQGKAFIWHLPAPA